MDCSKIINNLVAASCTKAEIPGIASRVILLNYAEVDQLNTVEVNNVVSNISLIPEAIGFTFESLENSTLGSSTLVTGAFYNEFEHTVNLRIFVKNEDAKAFMNSIKTAHLVAILENSNYNGLDSIPVKYEIYGLRAGLIASEAVHTTELIDGVVYSVILKSSELNRENSKPKTFFNADIETTDSLITLLCTINYSVKFLDYDASVMSSQQVVENGDAVVPAPTQNNLVFDSWIGNYVDVIKKEVVLAKYTTFENKAYLYITLDAITGLEPTLRMWIGQYPTTINWGDGTADETFNGIILQNKTHTYAAYGSYIITVTSSYLDFGMDDGGANVYPLFSGSYLLALTKYFDGYTTGSSKTNITGQTFNGCTNLQKVLIGKDAIELKRYAFYNCSALTSLIIPNTVATIGDNCFSGCTGMLKYIFLSTVPPVLYGPSVFTGLQIGAKIYVPDVSLTIYKTAEYWSDIASHIFPISSL